MTVHRDRDPMGAGDAGCPLALSRHQRYRSLIVFPFSVIVRLAAIDVWREGPDEREIPVLLGIVEPVPDHELIADI